MKTPRKLKKQINKSKIILDIRSKPKQLQVGEWIDLFKKQGILFYDSDNGDAPKILNSKLKPKIWTV